MAFDEEKTFYDIASLDLIDTTKGFQLEDPQVSVPIFTLIPRQHVFNHQSPALYQNAQTI